MANGIPRPQPGTQPTGAQAQARPPAGGGQQGLSPELGDAEFVFNAGLGFLRILQDPASAKNFGNVISQAATAAIQQGAQPQPAQPAGAPQGVAQAQAPGGGQAGVPLGVTPQAAGGTGTDIFKQVASMGNAARTGGLDFVARRGRSLNQAAQGNQGILGRAGGTV